LPLYQEGPESDRETLFFEDVLEDSLESDDDNELAVEETLYNILEHRNKKQLRYEALYGMEEDQNILNDEVRENKPFRLLNLAGCYWGMDSGARKILMRLLSQWGNYRWKFLD